MNILVNQNSISTSLPEFDFTENLFFVKCLQANSAPAFLSKRIPIKQVC